MNFTILGAGAIGCYVGGRLALGGQKVTFVGRPRVIDTLAAHGLTVTDLDGFNGHVDAARLRLAASLREANLDGDTVILLCVKGGATEAAARDIAQVCRPGTTIVSLQNGVDNVARTKANAPQMEVLAGMVPYNVVLREGNRGHEVHRATTGSLHIQRTALSEQLASAFNAAGLPTELSDDMRAVQWGKLLLNLNNPVNALSDLPLQAQLQDRDYRRVLADLQSEALAVMAASGITPAKVAAVAPRVLPHLLRLPNWLFTRVAARMLRMDASARSSMWDDLQQGRTTEIDDMCGAVVRLAHAHGGTAPLNQRMCELVAQHRAGKPEAAHGMSGPQMYQALSVN
jgi:2-dehydropantoate 2-reductase